MKQVSFDTVDSANTDSKFKPGDTVKTYDERNSIRYPCLHLETDVLDSNTVRLLQGVLAYKTLIENEDVYYIYLKVQDTLTEIGTVPSTRIKLLLENKAFKHFQKKAYLDKETSLEGDMLFALCMTTQVF